jgi:hypothetical protein
MASTVKHLRSSTANKRPTASGLADGQLGINTASGTPGVFFKDSAGTVTKVGPAHVGSTAPNVSPAGSAGNSLGELWVNNSTTINGLNYYTGSAFVNLTPSGTATVAGLVELATDAETQTGTDTVRAVTPSGLQSKISNSISTTSSTTIASSTAVKAAYDLADAALPKSGGRVTGALEIGPVGSLVFEGSSDDSFETTLAVVNPTAARTITFPNVTGTVVTTGDSGTVTSTMIADGAIVNADINASAAIVDTKLATIATAGKVSNSATTAASANTASTIVARDGSGNFTAGTITAALTGAASSNVLKAGDTMTGALVVPLASASTPSLTFTGDLNTGIYSPGADQVAISTNGTGRLFVDGNGSIGIGTNAPVATLHVIGGARLETTASGSTGLEIFNGTRNTGISSDFANDITFVDHNQVLIFRDSQNAYAERARIDSSGNVGIGTSAPGYKFQVNTEFGVDTDGGTGEVRFIAKDPNQAFYKYFSFFTQGANYAERMCITADGLVGIGTTSPGSALEINAAAATSPFIAKINTSEVARIDSSGRLLVGTSTYPAGLGSKLVVESAGGGAAEQNAFTYNSANTVGVYFDLIKSRGAAVGGTTIVASGDELAALRFRGYDGTNPIQAAAIQAFVDGTPGTDDMPGRLVFSTTADGAATPTERLRITSAGNVGIGTTSPTTPLQVVGTVTATTFVGALTGNASTVTTNANLTGHITSVGNAAVLGSFTSAQLAAALTDETGTGANVFATSPTLVTPALGTPSSGNLANCTFPTLNQNTTGNAATVTTNANLTGPVTSVGNATAIAAGNITNAMLATISTAGKVSGAAITSGDIATSGNLEITSATPIVRLTESDGTATHSQTVLIKNADQFSIQTRSSTGVLLSNDYLIPADASGATDHIWRIGNTEKARLTSDTLSIVGVVATRAQPANSNTSSTATASSLQDGLRTGNPSADITLTLPTGADMDAAFQDLANSQSFEWSVINTAAATHLITVTAAATGHTVVGNTVVAAATSGRFLTRKTATDTFVSYRIA